MLHVPSPSCTLEWGLCILTLGACWWRYRGTSASNVVRMFLKKLEVFLLPSRTTKCGEYVNQREERYLHGIPTAKSELKPRRYGRKPENMKKLPKDLNFYKTLSGLSNRKAEMNNNEGICSICSHPQKGLIRPEKIASKDLRNCLDCDTRASHNLWYVRMCAYFVFFWRKWFIGYQYSMPKYNALMSDVKVNQAIEETAKLELSPNSPPGTYEKLVAKHRQRTERIVTCMRAKQAANPYFSYFVRVASWIIGKTLGRIYPQILVRNAQIEVIRKARESGYSIVYLPVHRSHVDYVLVSWVLVACDIRAPLVAAGDNLNIPIFSLMMRSVGGFFIKRRLDCREGKRDIVYRAILHSYMTRSLTDDNDLEFFIEGGRTRTGKPCLPKGGLLSIVVDNLLAKKVDDVLIVPVNFSYERLLDGNFIREQLGRPKVSESFASAALGLWNSLQAKFGSARIDFGQPFSLREFVDAYQYDKMVPQSPLPLQNDHVAKAKAKLSQSLSNPSAPLPSMDIDSVEQREMVNNLAKHVTYDGEKCFSMMSTNAISFILLNKYRKGVTTQVLAREIEMLSEEMLDRGYDVGISGNMEDVITHGLTVLGPTLVRQDRTPSANGQSALIRPVIKLPNIIELAYYSNCVLPAYSLEAVIGMKVNIKSEILICIRNVNLIEISSN
ncbi:unnamed protein product [Orchesella dallaii]|uniref:Phospholipid/glycerol acyltransferase domain-containing protein n=1 Tax=Orchesella dallaii TaxID=48710 RepID=A0ABP1PU29_9HEXA